VEQLRKVSLEELQRQFGNKSGIHFHNQARGIASDSVGTERARQSISKETTFNEDISDLDTLRGTLLWLSSEVARIARRENLSGAVITLKIRLAGFETHTKQLRLEKRANSNRLIFQAGWELYRSSGFAGQPLRLIGIGLSGWEDTQVQQSDLFESPIQDEREKQLYETMDRITTRFGKEKLTLGTRRDKPN
jgi:DNA polymerase-4